MKKIVAGICMLWVFFPSFSYAVEFRVDGFSVSATQVKELENQYVFSFFADTLGGDIPESYKYIELKYSGVVAGTKLEDSLKKLVYLGKIKNIEAKVPYDGVMTKKAFFTFAEALLEIEIPAEKKTNDSVTTTDTNYAESVYKNKLDAELAGSIGVKNQVFADVYKTIKTDYYGREAVNDTELLESATAGLAEGTGDEYTVYFPPTQNKNLSEVLSGDYEGIGAYVDLRAPGEFYITSPVEAGPAEKAGILPGDRVLAIDGVVIEKDWSVEKIIAKIKGEAGTTVSLTILRDETEREIVVVREKVHIKSIEKERFDDTMYIQIKTFSADVSSEFAEVLQEITETPTIDTIIIDLRNNGGGYLGEVNTMLSHFIPKGEPTAVVKYLDNETKSHSKGYETLDLAQYKVIILINKATASASEILAGTLKDYFPELQVVGEKSFGKGSVQSIKQYKDGSSFKYTIAKWFTGKTETGIDKVGISPDIEVVFDTEAFTASGADNQLQTALDL